MTNCIIPDVAGLGIVTSVRDTNGHINNFKTIPLSKSSQEPHLKDLSTEPEATKEFGHEVEMGPEK